MNHDEKGDLLPVDRVLAEVHASEYDALLLPGGVKNPDTLRMDQKAVQFVREFMLAEKPVAAICHGPWLLVEANAVSGRTLTSWPSLQTDIRNAGGQWVDQPVQIDDRLITSRKPADIPAFSAAIVKRVREPDRRAAGGRAERAELSGERSAAEPERDRRGGGGAIAVTVRVRAAVPEAAAAAPGARCDFVP